jgi:hypothetical protein
VIRRTGGFRSRPACGFFFVAGGYDAGIAAGGGEMNENTIFVLLLAAVLILYMLPTLIAFARDLRRRRAVTIFNIILGWTLIGWIFVFLWAALGEPQPEET